MVIVALASDDALMESLVLKGGNAIGLIQRDRGKFSRMSYDLDYSMAADFKAEEVQEIKESVKYHMQTTFAENGYKVIDFKFTEITARKELQEFWGGYNIEFKIVPPELYEKHKDNSQKLSIMAIAILPSGSPRIEIEISKYEYVGGKETAMVDGYQISIYSPEMIVLEKVRAICQQLPMYGEVVHSFKTRARARDFYDIHYLITDHGIDPSTQENKQLLANIFAAKRVPLDYIARIVDHLAIHRSDWPNVVATFSAAEKAQAQPFDFYADFVVKTFGSLTFP